MWPRLHDQRPFLVVATSLVVLMWLSLVVGAVTLRPLPQPRGARARGRHRRRLRDGRSAFRVRLTLMTVAMMLPTSLPLVALFTLFERADRLRLTVVLVGGYVAVWTARLAVHLGDSNVHELVHRSAWLEANAWVIVAGTVLLAGAYQFSALKYRCLEKCRSPLSFVMGHWHGGRGGERGVPPGHPPRSVLPGLLLVADAPDVRRRRREPRLDAGARRRHGGREERLVGTPAERAAGRAPARLGRRPGRDPTSIATGA